MTRTRCATRSPGRGRAFIHAPYRINVASTNNRIRIPSRKLLGQQLAAAAAIGAQGLIVHGGHVTADADVAEGYENWAKAVEPDQPAGAHADREHRGRRQAMARGLDGIARLWDAIADAGGSGEVGFCLDTCHAFASGRGPVRDRGPGEGHHRPDRPGALQQLAGRVRLGPGPARRHGEGHHRPRVLADLVRAAGAPAICETPDPAADIEWLRAHIPGAD